ncbi:hypothetical protein [Kaistia granuli]|uniref:hypothetical protein n=1 Tax=Kaistia granuli TaxID=363259 RepID=UPI0012EC4536|nr:hypothetical protein [Kaistia granuli]
MLLLVIGMPSSSSPREATQREAGTISMIEDVDKPQPTVEPPPAPPPGCQESSIRTEDDSGATVEPRIDCPPHLPPEAPRLPQPPPLE